MARKKVDKKTKELVKGKSVVKKKGIECEDCGSKFAKQANLNAHVQNKHRGRRFECSECNKRFASKESCNRHIGRMHKKIPRESIIISEIFNTENIELSSVEKDNVLKRLLKENNNKDTLIKMLKKKIVDLQSKLDKLQKTENSCNSHFDRTYGVIAFKNWSQAKNEMVDILTMTTEELNEALSLFIKEVRKPDKVTEYQPDTIFYLVLGIQQHLFINGRYNNIFIDKDFWTFINTFDQIAKQFDFTSGKFFHMYGNNLKNSKILDMKKIP